MRTVTLWLPAALAVLLALLALRPRPASPSGSPGAETPAAAETQTVSTDDTSFRFARRLPIPEPPETVIRRGPVRDRVRRWFDRIQWGPIRVLQRTQNLSRTLDEDEQREFVRLTRELLEEAPGRAAYHVTCLGAFTVPEAMDLLRDAALNDDNRVRAEVARALTLLDDEEAARLAGKLLGDPVETVRRTALRALTEMENPESVRVLTEYARTDPDEGMRHVLARLSQEREDPSVIPILRRHVDRQDAGRVFARTALARWGDPETIDVLCRDLEKPDAREVLWALASLMEAPPELVPSEAVERRSSHPRPEVRTLAAQLLARWLPEAKGRRRSRILERLSELAADRDMNTRHEALRALYRAGRTEIAEPLRRIAARAHGGQLLSAVDVLTRVLEDRASEPLLRSRARHESEPNDLSILLRGLGNLALAKSLPVFLDVLRRAGPDEPRDGNGIELSRLAALYLESFAAHDALEPLLEIAQSPEETEWARLRALDALRAFGEADIAVELIEIAADPAAPRSVRIAALESLPFLEDTDWFEQLEDALDDLDDLEVARSARRVLLAYG